MKIPGTNDIPTETTAEWVKYFRRPQDAAGEDLYEGIFSNGYLMPLQRKAELRRMMQIARAASPRVVMEIGSDKGGGFYHWVKAFAPVKAIAIEYRGVPWADVFKDEFKATEFFCLEASSYAPATVRSVAEFLREDSIDCLFIDGDKSAFTRDVDSYLPMVRPGGRIFLHDVQDVKNAQEAMAAARLKFKTETILDTSEYDAILARESAGLPPADSYEGWFRTWRRSSCGVGVIYV